MKTSWLVLATAALTVMLCTQCSKAPNPVAKSNGDSIEGNVFLITNAGDLKPARFAKVWLWRGSHHLYEIFTSGPAFKTPEFEALCRSQLVEVANTEKGWVSEGETDEMGNFAFNNLPSGSYTVEAFGHSGLNAAIWSSDVSLESAATSHVKMGKPKVSCFDPDHVVPF